MCVAYYLLRIMSYLPDFGLGVTPPIAYVCVKLLIHIADSSS